MFLVEDGILPAQTSEVAEILTTRVEPEIFVPPLPGAAVHRAEGAQRDQALYFDQMEAKLPIGVDHRDEPLYLNLEFLDGTRGAHVNISGISGVATKTTYATFLLYSLFNSGVLGAEAINTKALIFNVKGEDLLFLDHANIRLADKDRERYAAHGTRAQPVRLGRRLRLAPQRRSCRRRLPTSTVHSLPQRDSRFTLSRCSTFRPSLPATCRLQVPRSPAWAWNERRTSSPRSG